MGLKNPNKIYKGHLTSFVTNDSLMFLIQEITKRPSHEILGFFADLATRVVEIGAEAMPKLGTSSMKKKIVDYFPGTSIPFFIEVTGDVKRWYNEKTVKPEGIDELVEGHASIQFPELYESQDLSEIAQSVVEGILLGGTTSPPFEKPQFKIPKMYKELMEEIRAKRMV